MGNANPSISSFKKLGTLALGLLILATTFGCGQIDISLIKPSETKETKKVTKTEEAPKEVKSKKEVKGVKQVPHIPVTKVNATEEEQQTSRIEEAQQEDESSDEKESKYPRYTWEEKSKIVKEYCSKTEKTFTRYGWGQSNCENYAWQFVRTSVNGDPLIWRTYGEPATDDDHTETTLIMCGVHGDEITPIKFCYDVLQYMEKISQGKVIDPHTNKQASLKGKLVIVAPLVNPDSYFKKRPTRTNANGIDVNRNFPTRDFNKLAMKSWIDRYRRDKRRYPGKKAMSEPETIFQVNLIYRYRPDKIISVHAPLTMLDYDGPASEHTGGKLGSRANQLLIRMSEQAKGYRIKNYPFFPGSLGNYAGNERNIPTFTLELPTSDPAKANSYWALFKESIHSAVMHEIRGKGFVALDQEQNPLREKKQSNN